jgi:hypothetical protein
LYGELLLVGVLKEAGPFVMLVRQLVGDGERQKGIWICWAAVVALHPWTFNKW